MRDRRSSSRLLFNDPAPPMPLDLVDKAQRLAVTEAISCLSDAGTCLLTLAGGGGDRTCMSVGGSSVLTAIGGTGLALMTLAESLEQGVSDEPCELKQLAKEQQQRKAMLSVDCSRECRHLELMQQFAVAWEKVASSFSLIANRLRWKENLPERASTREMGGRVPCYFIGEAGDEEEEGEKAKLQPRKCLSAKFLARSEVQLSANASSDPVLEADMQRRRRVTLSGPPQVPSSRHHVPVPLFQDVCGSWDWPLSRLERKIRVLMIEQELAQLDCTASAGDNLARSG